MLPTGGVVIDLGTGDGHFVYQGARKNRNKFYIGIDASPKALEKASEKIHRKPAKGGLPNVLFVRASVEDLPEELDGVANEVHVHFPWGSLLRAVATGDPTVLRSIRRVCAPRAWLEVVISLDPARDRAEIARLRLPPLSVEFLKTTLVSRYRAAGFEVTEHRRLSPSECSALRTTWTKRLRRGATRPVFCFIARCGPSPGGRTKKRLPKLNP